MNFKRSFLVVLATSSTCALAQFTPGNLAILRVGDGTQAFSNTGNTVFIDEYSPAGAFVRTVMIPDAGASALVLNGTATAEGFLARSANGQYLTFAGYNTARPYANSVSTSLSADVPRAVGMVDNLGAFSIPASSSTAYSGLSWRSAVTDGIGNFWGVGSGTGGGGPLYMGSETMLQTSLTTLRGANIIDGDLYFTHTGSAGTGPGLFYFTGTPTEATAPTLLFSTGASAGTTDFALNAAGTIAYVADDRGISSGGGLQKWVFDGSAWTLAYTLGTGSGSTVGARGLAVDFSGADPVLYATTAESSAMRLITVTDTGASSAVTTLATAPANMRFRGLDFAPIPEPSALALAALGVAAALLRRRS